MGTRISELPLETVPLDADFVPAVKAGVTSRFTWTSIKAFLKTYFDGLYAPALTAFTPVLQFGGASVGITYSTQIGKYLAVGNLVYVKISITLTSKGTSTGVATINMPVAANNDTANTPLTLLTAGVGFAGYPAIRVIADNSYAAFAYSDESGGFGNLTDVNFTNISTILISGWYQK